MTGFRMWDGIQSIPAALEQTGGWAGELPAAAAALAPAAHVDVAGCGTSYFAGMAVAHLLQEAAELPAQAHNAYELATYPPPAGGDRSLVAISHTGTTPDAVAAARARRAPTIALTDAADSPLAAAAGHVLCGPGGMETALPKTRSYLTTLQRGFALALEVAGARGRDVATLAAGLERTRGHVGGVLADGGTAVDAAARFAGARRIVVVGGGPELATANEGALKITEAAGMHADAWEVEEAAHGTWASAGEGELAIVLAPGGRSGAAIGRISAGLRTIGVPVWAIGSDARVLAEADRATPLPDVPEAFAPMLSVLVLYRFAYELALARRVDPDVMRQDRPAYRDARTIMRRTLSAA